jgi:hypothetical protein
LRRVEVTGAQELRLYFTEIVRVEDGFRPDQFRLSVGAGYAPEGYVGYYDLGDYFESEGGADVSRVETIDGTSLRLVLREPMPADGCAEINELRDEADPSRGGQAGLFLHYREDDAGIVDREGRHLGDIAPQWVIRGADEAYYTGRRIRPIQAFGPIPCVFGAEQ